MFIRSLSARRRIALGLLAAMTLSVPAVSALPSVPAQAPGVLWEAPVRLNDDAANPQDIAAAAQEVSVPTFPEVTVDGEAMTEDPMLTAVEDVTYVSLRAVALALLPGATAAWDGTQATVTCEGVLELTAAPGETYFSANGRYFYVPGQVLFQDGAVLVPLTELCDAMDASCVWTDEGYAELTTGHGGIVSGEEFYDEDDLYWLSRIIHAESGNQPLEGKLAVGNVVLNRVADSRFPSSVKGVIFQRNQFSPVSSGSIYKAPNAESVLAAKLCLDGAEALEDVLYFNQAGLRSWASRNRTHVATIASHAFYA